MPRFPRLAALACLFSLVHLHPALAQESPHFVTYNHYLEEPRTLEIALSATTGFPKNGQPAYSAPWLELEYGVSGWWTTSLYLEGVMTRRDGSGFAGWRWENRFRPLKGEHRVNPVLYVEYESINEASRIQKDIVGSGPVTFAPIGELRQTHAHELEGKLILSGGAGAWNLAGNLVVEKNLSADEGLEFGYSAGVSRPLGGLASGTSCHLCRENFVVGVEVYGGLGSTKEVGLADTRHFVAPVVAWHMTDRSTLKLSTAIGLTPSSDRYLLRLAWSYELNLGGGR